MHVDDKLSIGLIGRFGVNGKVETRGARTDKCGHTIDPFVAMKFIFSLFKIFRHRLDTGSFRRPVIDHEFCHGRIRKEHLIDLSKAHERHNKKGNQCSNGEEANANCPLHDPSKDPVELSGIRVGVLFILFGLRQHVDALQGGDGHGYNPARKQ